jgi:hypothetical protein
MGPMTSAVPHEPVADAAAFIADQHRGVTGR